MGSPKQQKSNVETVRETYEAFATGDVPSVLGALDANIEWHMSEHHPYWRPDAFVGPQAVLQSVFARIMQDFDGFTIEVQRIVGCGDTVLAELRYRATSKASGKALDAQAAHVFDFRNGKVARYQQYTDTLQFAEVLGVGSGLER